MKTNYQLVLNNIIENINKENKVPSLLLHSCCAPCSSYVIEYLSNYFNITIYYYNPNISPNEEFEKRSLEQIRLIDTMKTKHKVNYIISKYDNSKYEDIIKGLENESEGGNRCFKCYTLRLEETCKFAKDNNYDFFGTTLSVSPYKNSQKLNEIGEYLQKKYNINYLYADFKKNNGYKRSIELSKQYNLYRQDYCGCIYSKNERIEKNARKNI